MTEPKNPKQDKCLSCFSKLDIMSMMEVLDKCKEMADEKIEAKKQEVQAQISIYNLMQEKIKGQ